VRRVLNVESVFVRPSCCGCIWCMARRPHPLVVRMSGCSDAGSIHARVFCRNEKCKLRPGGRDEQ
jgi:hypothetical protein